MKRRNGFTLIEYSGNNSSYEGKEISCLTTCPVGTSIGTYCKYTFDVPLALDNIFLTHSNSACTTMKISITCPNGKTYTASGDCSIH